MQLISLNRHGFVQHLQRNILSHPKSSLLRTMTLLTDSHQLESKRRSVAMAAPHSLVHVEVLITREEALNGLLAMQMIVNRRCEAA